MTPGLRERHSRRDGVVQRRGAARPDPRQSGRDPLAIRRPGFDELGLIVESIEEHFVVSIEQLEEETIERLPRRHPLLALHAAARVDDETQADRHALAVEVRDLLFLAVLEEAEVFLAQARDEPAVGVGDCCRDVDELDAGLEAEDLRIRGS